MDSPGGRREAGGMSSDAETQTANDAGVDLHEKEVHPVRDLAGEELQETFDRDEVGENLDGLLVDDSDDDDPVLIRADGRRVDTWRENYPYDERLDRDVYEAEKRLLQIELLKLQNWVKA